MQVAGGIQPMLPTAKLPGAVPLVKTCSPLTAICLAVGSRTMEGAPEDWVPVRFNRFEESKVITFQEIPEPFRRCQDQLEEGRVRMLPSDPLTPVSP